MFNHKPPDVVKHLRDLALIFTHQEIGERTDVTGPSIGRYLSTDPAQKRSRISFRTGWLILQLHEQNALLINAEKARRKRNDC